MVQQVLLEHPTPSFDDIHQHKLERFDIELQPATKDPPIFHLAYP